ncbi:MAG TPA: hypothetical protein VNW95_08995 [Mucilaginibacter sp.]|nr:hypothetical protein [Mucilaginibacter sp.]
MTGWVNIRAVLTPMLPTVQFGRFPAGRAIRSYACRHCAQAGIHSIANAINA